MLKIRCVNEWGYVNYGWLKVYYSFFFVDYFDCNYMYFFDLWVINEDFV